MKTYLLRYGEINLKGKNRPFFERKLSHSLKSYLKNKNVEGSVKRLRNRIYVETADEVDWRPIFGLVNYSPCIKINGNYEAIQEEVKTRCKPFTDKTKFRITTNKMDPSFPLSKQEMNEQLGSLVVEQTGAKVSLKGYDEEIGIEVLQGKAYIYSTMIPCHGGLPVGVEGSALLLMDFDAEGKNEKSLLAGVLAMRRGCAVFPIAEKHHDIQLLDQYAYGTKPQFKLFSEINLPEFIERYELQALIVGDTLSTLKRYDEIPLPVLRPLIGYTEEKIKEEMKRYR
ncbi:MAG: THUMP domain-containing protein [Nanoarchaeota archaeon]